MLIETISLIPYRRITEQTQRLVILYCDFFGYETTHSSNFAVTVLMLWLLILTLLIHYIDADVCNKY